MKAAIVALFAAALMSVAPAVSARAASSKAPDVQHHASRTHHRGVSGVAFQRQTLAKRRSKAGYPGVFGYAPAAPNVSDQDFTRSRQFGGGGGGGGGSM
jgi:hypothetical protein